MAGWHHWLEGCESQWTLGVGGGQGGLVCCNSWGHKESDTTERLIWSDLIWLCFVYMASVDTLQQAPRILASVGNKLFQVHLQLTWLECPPSTVAESFPVFSINLWNLLYVVSFRQSWSSLLHSHWFSQFQHTAADFQEWLPIYVLSQFWILRVFFPH